MDTDVLVVGAGPTGLMLACELALAGVKVRILDRRDGQSNITRAFAVHARTLELLDARGLAADLVPRGVPVKRLVGVNEVVRAPWNEAERVRESVGGRTSGEEQERKLWSERSWGEPEAAQWFGPD